MPATLSKLVTPRGSTTAALLAALVACGQVERVSPTEPDFSTAPRELHADLVGGLTQTLRLSATSLHPGDVLVIQATVVNHGAEPAVVTSRVCGLDVAPAELRAPDQWVRCQGYSMSGPLPPGASRLESEHILIADRPGVHTLRVRHMLDPKLWLEAEIEVR